MQTDHRLIRCTLALLCFSHFITPLVMGAAIPSTAADSNSDAAESANLYKWNIEAKDAPLLGLAADHMKAGFDQSLAYPAAQFDFAIFRSLIFDETEGKYLLPTISKSNKGDRKSVV